MGLSNTEPFANLQLLAQQNGGYYFYNTGPMSQLRIGYTAPSPIAAAIPAATSPPEISQPAAPIDRSYKSAAYGAPIPKHIGTVAIHLNIIWLKGQALDVIDDLPYATFAGLIGEPLDLSATRTIGQIWMDGRIVRDGSGTDLLGGLDYTYYDGNQIAPDPDHLAACGADLTPAYVTRDYIVFRNLQLEAFANTIPAITVEIIDSTNTTVSFQTVATKVSIATGRYVAADFTFTGTSHSVGTGFIIPQTMDIKNFWQSMCRFYGWDYYEDETGDIHFVRTVVNATYTVAGALDADDFMWMQHGAIEMSRADPEDAPAIIETMYINESRQYEYTPSRVRRPAIPEDSLDSSKKEMRTINAVMSASEALNWNALDLYRQDQERQRWKFKLLPGVSLRYVPTDIVTFTVTELSLSYTVKITRVTTGSDRLVEFEAVTLQSSQIENLTGYVGETDGVIGVNVEGDPQGMFPMLTMTKAA